MILNMFLNKNTLTYPSNYIYISLIINQYKFILHSITVFNEPRCKIN